MYDDMDDELPGERSTAEGGKGLLPESVRKALVTGLSAVFMTEEGIRNIVSDMRLPKDAIAFLAQQTERSRKELFRVVSEELKGFLRGVDVTGAVRKALAGMRVEVRAEVRFIEDDTRPSGVRTEVRQVRAGARPVAEPRKRRRPVKKSDG